jgi:hypothetical protein
MTDGVMSMKYEFFSWRGFVIGAASIILVLVVQSYVSFPVIWVERALPFALHIIGSSLIVGIASGSVLVYLFPPQQDVIGLAGLGSDDATQHIALFLVILALVQPIFAGFIFFFDYYGQDPFIIIWVIAGFAAPSAGFASAMFERTNALAKDLAAYFKENKNLDLSSLKWLKGHGPRTTVYRMGILESAAGKVEGVRLRGHEIVRVVEPQKIESQA